MDQVFQPFHPEDVQAAFAAVLVDEWVRAGVSGAVVCPGSRSTPLLVALAEAAEDGLLDLHVLLDERAAAFFALGLAKASGLPSLVVTTSGTAAAELHAAVIEADHACIPMLAVTADRPAELHDWGAPQTVRQEQMFGAAVRWEASPGVPEEATAWAWRSLASRAVLEAVGGKREPGPVHLNLAFREPLIGRASAFLGSLASPRGVGPGMSERRQAVDLQEVAERDGTWGAGPDERAGGGRTAQLLPALELLPSGRPARHPWHRVLVAAPSRPPARAVEAVAGSGERGLVVAGGGAGAASAVRALSAATGWPVLADPMSGCRWEGSVCAADALLRTEVLRRCRPDVVVRLGSPWASRVLNEWLAGLDCPQWLVNRWGKWSAPDRLPGEMVLSDPEAFCRAVAAEAASRRELHGAERAGTAASRAPSTAEEVTGGGGGAQVPWWRVWAEAEAAAQQAIDEVLSGAGSELTGPLVARTITRCLPQGATVMVASSMPVRDLEWWGLPREDLRVLCNRGANGIDGVLSSALGVAAAGSGLPVAHEPWVPPAGERRRDQDMPAAGNRVVAVLGDLAFVYDASALLWSQLRGFHLDVVVVDNSGGGIFSFLPQARTQPRERFERLWGTPHGLDLVSLAESYGAQARVLEGPEDLAAVLSTPAGRPGVRVWVAQTTRESELSLREALWSAVQTELARLSGATGSASSA